MPALESRRVRTQPLTVTLSSCGAWPARMARTLSSVLSIERELRRRHNLVQGTPPRFAGMIQAEHQLRNVAARVRSQYLCVLFHRRGEARAHRCEQERVGPIDDII